VKTSLAPGSKVRHRLPRIAAAWENISTNSVSNWSGLRLYDVHRQQRPARRTYRRGHQDNSLVAVSVLSGNRNFEGRIHPLVRANYLASPPLVVAYALAGRMDFDMATNHSATTKAGSRSTCATFAFAAGN